MTNQDKVFLTMLRGLRNALASAVDQIDVILDAAEQPTLPMQETECQHPVSARSSRAAMGHPDRFYCSACKKEVEG